MQNHRLRILCCLCRKPIPRGRDAYALDAEWQRRYPTMVGTIACATCAVASKDYYFQCERRNGQFVDGHIAVDRQSSHERDFDSWCHILAHGTQTALAYRFPASALQQGAEDWLRHTVQRPQLNSEVRARIQDALAG